MKFLELVERKEKRKGRQLKEENACREKIRCGWVQRKWVWLGNRNMTRGTVDGDVGFLLVE